MLSPVLKAGCALEPAGSVLSQDARFHTWKPVVDEWSLAARENIQFPRHSLPVRERSGRSLCREPGVYADSTGPGERAREPATRGRPCASWGSGHLSPRIRTGARALRGRAGGERCS